MPAVSSNIVGVEAESGRKRAPVDSDDVTREVATGSGVKAMRVGKGSSAKKSRREEDEEVKLTIFHFSQGW